MKEVALPEAVAALQRGFPVIYPTETLYGLGVDITQAEALERLFKIKGRDFSKPVSVLIGSQEQLAQLVREVSPLAKKIMARFFPGPLTLVLPASKTISPRLHAGTGWIGIRQSSHPLAQALVHSLGRPITATSANPSGSASGRELVQLKDYFSGEKDLYFLNEGDLPSSLGSTVIRVEGEKIKLLRAGDMDFHEIKNLL